MSLTVQACMNKLKSAHPDLYPIWWIEDKGTYLIAMLKRGVSKEDAPVNFYAVDPKSEQIAGPIPAMMVFGNDDLAAKLDNPHKVNPEEQKPLLHSVSMQSDFLMHYGIPGMRWGIRRFQNEDGTLTAAGKERYGVGTSPDKKKSEDKPKESEKKSPAKEQPKDDKSKEPEKLSWKEKGLINTAQFAEMLQKNLEADTDHIIREQTKKNDTGKRLAIDVLYTVVNPINAVYLAKDGIGQAVAKTKVKNYMKDREANSEFDEKTGLYKKKEGQYDDKKDLAAVNPGFMDMNSNSKNNCMLCTTTYDLRKRGWDVTAQLDSIGYTFPDLKRWYPKAKLEKISRFDENGRGIDQKQYMERTIKTLEKQGNGARGNIMMFWTLGGAHSIVYEVQNGQVVFKDGQTNKVYTDPTKLLKQTITSSYARLDSVQPDMEMIKKECVR